ncbi:hypothetical protein [Cryobacterium zongtaii]|uniref:hypothetical protein n=1 Tax=Cryobacterium zongtaii TaxID=1259217 RepID=UPI0013FD2FF6|nr:hypothetical protein [Cryobacterium zongtaii]
MVIVGGGRRGVGRMVAAACVGGLLLGAAGCTAAPKPAPPTPTPTITPIFASDEEALAAATEAYANYVSTYDASWADGDGSMSDYLALTVGEAHANDERSFGEWTSKNWRPVGTTSFDSVQLQSVSQTDSGAWQIRAYLCLDASDGDVVDASGISIARADRPMRVPLEVAFVTESPTSDVLRISESNVWSGKTC